MDLPQTKDTNVAHVAELIRGIRIAMVTTVTQDGRLHARPMAAQELDFDGALWFFTERETAKVREARDDEHASVTFTDTERNRYVTLEGRIRVVEDRAKIHELWHEMLTAWFPKGPTDPDVTLLRFEPTVASFWEGPSSRIVRIFRIVQALVSP
jgi:general stress protein 26